MKRINSIIASAAAVMFAAVSCVPVINPEPEPQEETKEISFRTANSLTKTTIEVNGEDIAITWNNTDNSFVHLFENGSEGSKAKISITDNGAGAEMSASFSGLGVSLSGFTYSAIIAGHYADGIATVPAVQYPAATSFDPAADILIGSSSKKNIRPSSVEMKFARAVAISRLELSGLVPGEKVEMIEICATNNIAGPLKKLVNNEFAGYAEEGSNKITLEFSENNTVSSEGKFIAYFTSRAVKPGTFAVNVVTDNTIYFKESPADKAAALKFNFDKLRNIKVDLGAQSLPEQRYELVTSAPSNWEGTYVIANNCMAGSARILNAGDKGNGYAKDVTVTNFGGRLMIAANDAIDACSWDISNSGKTENGATLWNVKTGSAGIFFGLIGGNIKYLYDKNGITTDNNNYTGTILNRTYYYHMFAYDNGVQMTSFNGKDRTYLGYSGNAFSYSSDQTSRVYLFRYNDSGRQSQILAYDNETVHWTIADDKYRIGGTYEGQPFSSSSKYQPDLLTFTSSDTSVATVDNEGKITILKQGTVTITATAANTAEFRGASASYQIVISEPYYQRVTNAGDITNGDKYIIVSKTEILGIKGYHAFNASDEETYDYDINTLSNIFSNPVYDNGDRIKSLDAINANQVIIDKGFFSTIASLVGLNGGYTIKPVSVDKYMYCDLTATTEVAGQSVIIPEYKIAFSDVNLEGLSLTQIGSWFNKIATIPHSITFAEDGTASIRSAVSKNSAIGADLYYSKITRRYSYVNMMILDNFESIAELVAYIGQDSEYAWLLNIISYIGQNASISDLVDYFAADLYIYKYIE